MEFRPLFITLWVCFNCAFAVNFRSCGGGSSNQISGSYTLDKKKIPLPGTVTASVTLQLNTKVDHNTEVQVEIRRPVLWWSVKLPCIKEIGSCTYSDICSMMEKTKAKCNGQACRCPVNPGTYSWPNNSISTNNIPWFISSVASGTTFDVKAKFINKVNGGLLACLQTSVEFE